MEDQEWMQCCTNGTTCEPQSDPENGSVKCLTQGCQCQVSFSDSDGLCEACWLESK